MQVCLTCKTLVPKNHAEKTEHVVKAFGLLLPKKGGPRVLTIVRPIRDILKPMEIPESFDLRDVNGVNLCPPIINQEDEGICTGCGVRLAQGTMERMAGEWVEESSVRLVYEHAKFFDGITGDGAYMQTIVRVMLEYGNCRDHYEPFIVNDPDRKGVWPPIGLDSEMDAANWKIQMAYEIHTDPNPIEAMQLYLMQYGAPDLGTPWTQSWVDNWISGWLPLPPDNDELKGGHSWGPIGWFYQGGVLYFIGQNSWGTSNLLGGYFHFPAETFFCKNWQAMGGWEGYAFVNATSISCPSGQHYDFGVRGCVEDASGPQPSKNCLDLERICMDEVMQQSDPLAIFFGAVGCAWDGVLCALGYGEATRNKKKGTIACGVGDYDYVATVKRKLVVGRRRGSDRVTPRGRRGRLGGGG